VGSLQDLWLPNPAGWSLAAANLLNSALAASTWKRYAGNLRRFKAYCLANDISFPPERDEAVGAIASFLESATQSSQQPRSTVASLSAAIGALYETADFHPTRDPLLSRVKHALVRLRTTRPIKHGAVFDTSALRNLFLKWGASLSLQQLRAKLLAMLCVLGALRVASTVLPKFDQVTIVTAAGHRALSVPIVGYKNDLYGDGKHVTLHESSNELCCPVRTFEAWKKRTRSLRRSVRNCPLLFSLQRPIEQLSAARSAAILKELATDAGLDPAVFTAKTFRKSGVMAGIHAGVEPDAIFRLGGWRSAETFYRHYVVQAVPRAYTDLIFDVDEADTDHLSESTL
jgi:hypothetical protein